MPTSKVRPHIAIWPYEGGRLGQRNWLKLFYKAPSGKVLSHDLMIANEVGGWYCYIKLDENWHRVFDVGITEYRARIWLQGELDLEATTRWTI